LGHRSYKKLCKFGLHLKIFRLESTTNKQAWIFSRSVVIAGGYDIACFVFYACRVATMTCVFTRDSIMLRES